MDSADNAHFACEAFDVAFAKNDDILFNPSKPFQETLVEFKDQKKVNKKRNSENRRWKSTPFSSEDINENDTQ
jgi:hypothetical protein